MTESISWLAQAAQPNPWLQFVPLILIFFIFYFLVIQPMRKKQMELQKTIDALKKGDGVVTTGGLYGEVVSVESSTLILKIADGVKVKVLKSAISGLQGAPGGSS